MIPCSNAIEAGSFPGCIYCSALDSKSRNICSFSNRHACVAQVYTTWCPISTFIKLVIYFFRLSVKSFSYLLSSVLFVLFCEQVLRAASLLVGGFTTHCKLRFELRLRLKRKRTSLSNRVISTFHTNHHHTGIEVSSLDSCRALEKIVINIVSTLAMN